MPSYDSSLLEPAAPVARVLLRNPVTGQEMSDVPMLIDSGADITFLPAMPLRRWRLPPTGKRYQLITVYGTRSYSAAVQLELVLAGRSFRGLFLLIDQRWGVLGRNILNHLSLTLDGPAGTWKLNPR